MTKKRHTTSSRGRMRFTKKTQTPKPEKSMSSNKLRFPGAPSELSSQPSPSRKRSKMSTEHLSPQPPSTARPHTSSSSPMAAAAAAATDSHFGQSSGWNRGTATAAARPNTTSSSPSSGRKDQHHQQPVSMSQQIGFSLAEGKFDASFEQQRQQQQQQQRTGTGTAAAGRKKSPFAASPERTKVLLGGLPNLHEKVTTSKEYEHDARTLSNAMAKWRGPSRAPINENLIQRRIATAGRVPHSAAASAGMAGSVLSMIERCGGQEFAEKQRRAMIHEDEVDDFVADLPFIVGAERREGREKREAGTPSVSAAAAAAAAASSSSTPRQRNNRRKSVVVETANGEFQLVDTEVAEALEQAKVTSPDVPLPGESEPEFLSRHLEHFRLVNASKYPPRAHRPAQRDFLSWSSGAALSYESFTSANRWVEWVLREAEFHARRIAKEAGNEAHNDALDLAEVMKSNFDNLLVDATSFYEEIKQRAAEINDCVKSWSRVRDHHKPEQSNHHHHKKKKNSSKNRRHHHDDHDEEDDLEDSEATAGPLDTVGEPFLVRAAFLVLDRILSSSANMKFLWPKIRSALLRGIFVSGEEVMHEVIEKQKQREEKEAGAGTTKLSSSSSSPSSPTAKAVKTDDDDALPRALATHPLLIEQYDDLLHQFREAERQRFHLESTSSQLSAFSDLTAKHNSRRLIRSAFKAWRAIAHAGKVHERIIVHFARQAKAKEICGRTLHRWRSYTQQQRRVRAIKNSDEIRRQLRHTAAEHDGAMKTIHEEHERKISSYEIKILQLEQQYEAAVEGAALERTMLEEEISSLKSDLDKSQHLAQQWRTAALLSRPTEGPDAVALYANDEEQKRSVLEMSLALAPPSRKLQQLISAVRGAEDALYMATIRASTTAQERQNARTAALRRQVDGAGSLASPTAASLAKSLNSESGFFGASSRSPKGGDEGKSSTRNRKKGGDSSSPASPNFKPIPQHGVEWGDLPSMNFNAAAAAAASSSGNGNDSSSKSPSSPSSSPKPSFNLFAKPENPLLGATLNSTVTGIGAGSGAVSKNLRSANTGDALRRPDLNFQALAAAAREAVQSFLVEWVNEMLAKSTHGRTVMHAGVQRNTAGTTEARKITNLTTDLYDGSVYLLLCKAILPAEHQRRGEADVFSTIVSTLFVFSAHGLQPPLIVHCPFYRRFFRADTFNTFIHPTAGLWIVASLFCGYALRSAQSPNYRGHAALAPVQQYSPGGKHKVTRTAATANSREATVVARPPLNILIMSGVNTCGYGTKRATTGGGAGSRGGDAGMLHRLGVALDKTVNANKEGDGSNEVGEGEGGNNNNNNNNNTMAKSSKRRRKKRNDDDSFDDNDDDDDDDGGDDEFGARASSEDDDDDNDQDMFDDEEGEDEEAEVDFIEDALPGAVGSPLSGSSPTSARSKRNLKREASFDANAWLDSVEAMEAARKAVPDTLLGFGPSELLSYWRTSQENRSIWVGCARVLTSLVVRFRVFDVDTKRSMESTARRHLQPHLTSVTATTELKGLDSHRPPDARAAAEDSAHKIRFGFSSSTRRDIKFHT